MRILTYRIVDMIFVEAERYTYLSMLLVIPSSFVQAYASGCNIVILASDFQRVQIIPGASYGGIEITCISSCSEVGKVCLY